MNEHEQVVLAERNRLSRFFSFAEGVLAARENVILKMEETGLGMFLEDQIQGLPGVSLNGEGNDWLRLERLRETPPPPLEEDLSGWLEGACHDPKRMPQFRVLRVVEMSLDDASDLCEMGVLEAEDINEVLVEDATASGARSREHVAVVLRLERLEGLRDELESWRDGVWSRWAESERSLRRSISLYNALFKLHNMLHGSVASTPPELVWGIGIARWRIGGQSVDMPLIEQLVDIEVQPRGTIVVRPRTVSPALSLKPFLHLEIDGAEETQRSVQALFDRVTEGEYDISPFEPSAWEGVLDLAARRLSSRARHVTRAALAAGS